VSKALLALRGYGGRAFAGSRGTFPEKLEDGCVKAAWNIRIEEGANGTCEVSTETRIVYFGRAARHRFRLYWTFIRPFSGAIRIGLLRGIRRRAERPSPV
jgi:hypothetical protein